MCMCSGVCVHVMCVLCMLTCVCVCESVCVCVIFTVKCVCAYSTCKERECQHVQIIHHLRAEDLEGRVKASNPLCSGPYSAHLTFEVKQEQATAILSNILHLTQVYMCIQHIY